MCCFLANQVLIFSQFTRMLDVLEDYLDLRGLDRGRLDGSMAFAERETQMAKFKESPDCMVFLLSTRAGGLGINLTSADTVIIYDSDWVRDINIKYIVGALLVESPPPAPLSYPRR